MQKTENLTHTCYTQRDNFSGYTTSSKSLFLQIECKMLKMCKHTLSTAKYASGSTWTQPLSERLQRPQRWACPVREFSHRSGNGLFSGHRYQRTTAAAQGAPLPRSATAAADAGGRAVPDERSERV